MNLNGQKINLRYTTLDDADSITKYCAEKEISKYTIIPHPYTLQNAIDFINMCIDDRKSMASLHYGIEHKETKEIIGMIDVNSINKTHRRGELGYWLAKPFWGKGIMLEAINLLTDYCFQKMQLERIYAHVQPDNIGSWKLLEKARFEREGLLKKFLCIKGTMRDRFIYARLRD
ncbi:MAG TPA: N-acetyltransferase [candidate division Zixibacteria bacterium]|nr:N-acetyltransferase [candidate division Zixibacteria bacterium]